MRAFWKLAVVQAKLYWREPIGVFFTLLFGPALMVMMGFIFGNAPQSVFGGHGQLDVSTPAYAALVIGITGVTIVPITAVGRRELGVLRRFSATPLRPLTYFLSDILAPFAFTLVGIALLFLTAMLVYGVSFKGQWLSLLAGVGLSAVTFFALGHALAGVLPNARIATAVGNAVIIPMNIFSGAVVPLQVMPAGVQAVARFLSLTHVVSLLTGLWFRESWGAHLLEVAVLVGLLIVGMAVVALTFKWE